MAAAVEHQGCPGDFWRIHAGRQKLSGWTETEAPNAGASQQAPRLLAPDFARGNSQSKKSREDGCRALRLRQLMIHSPNKRCFMPARQTATEPSFDVDREIFTIRDLVKECGVTARTLRFYEEKGLLSPRRDGLERLYTRRDRARLKYVLMGRNVGFSLDEVREMLDLYDLGDGQETQLRVALSKFHERLTRLERQKTDIERVIDELRRACDTVGRMLERGAPGEPGMKPRFRMRAARSDIAGEANRRS
ncbi:MAG: MerR family transcriptional regulator [Xanthobacteraceae bacterium]